MHSFSNGHNFPITIIIFNNLYTILYYIIYITLSINIFSLLKKKQCKSSAYLGGKTAVVTGGSSGIGYEIASSLASRGCKIIIADIVDCKKAVERMIEETDNSNISSMYLNLGSLASVREFAKLLLAKEEHLDLLINHAECAGFLHKTIDGVYKVIQVNYLGHFLLTHLLAPLLIATESSKVVFNGTCSDVIHTIDKGGSLNELPTTKNEILRDLYLFNNSKVCTLLASYIFAERFKEHDVHVSSYHYGITHGNGIFEEYYENAQNFEWQRQALFIILWIVFKLFGRSTHDATQSILHCALSPEVKSGDYIKDCKQFPTPLMLSKKLQAQIWNESLLLADISQIDE